MKGFLKVVVVAVAGLWLAILGVMFALQRTLLFPADPREPEIGRAGLPDARTLAIVTGDGERLVAWYVPPRRDDAPVFLYFHGNAGNLGRPGRADRLRLLVEDGSGLLAIHHRGYGGSTGSPSEAGLHADARAAWHEAARRHGPSRLVAYGESLGTGVAVRLAVDRDVAAVVLDAPYTATSDVAAARYPFLPVDLLMRDPFRSRDIVGRITAPLLILHGTDDRVIPVEQGIALAGLARAPSRLVVFRGGRHESLPRDGGIHEVRAFLADAAAGSLRPNERRDRDVATR